MIPTESDVSGPDVALAVEFLDGLGIARWERINENLMNPSPWIRKDDLEHIESMLGWANKRLVEPRSRIDAATSNAYRVLSDLNLVLSYDLTWPEASYARVNKWYRAWAGRKGEYAQIENWGGTPPFPATLF